MRTARWSSRKSGPRPNLPRSSPQHARHSSSGRPGRLRRWGKRFAWAGLSSLLVAGLSLGYREVQPFLQDWFEVRDVLVRGATQVTRKEVLDRLALMPGVTLLSVDMERLAARLRGHPWIKGARVDRRLPHTLEIQIQERRPAAILRTPTLALLLDEEGHVLALSDDDEKGQGLPLLTGVDPNALIQGDGAARAAAQSGVRLATLLQSEAGRGGVIQRGSSIQIDVSHPDNVMASVKGVHFQFGSSAFEEKWGRYQLVESDLPTNVGKAGGSARSGNGIALRSHEIDLRYQGKVIVRERG